MLFVDVVPSRSSGAVHLEVPPVCPMENDESLNTWESDAVDRPKSARQAWCVSVIKILTYKVIGKDTAKGLND